LAHLGTRNFSAATRRAYAYDLLNFLRFLVEQGVRLAAVRATDLFDYLDWQGQPPRAAGFLGGALVRVARRGAGDDEPADRSGARAVRVRRGHRRD